MAQLIRITSEALQATVRRLLPSQQGFGEELQASNVITPIIDLTPTAQGDILPYVLSSAINFGGSTLVNVNTANTTIADTPGFYQVDCNIALTPSSTVTTSGTFNISDGLTTKQLFGLVQVATTDVASLVAPARFTVFLDTGESLNANSSGAGCTIYGSIRQVADRYGTITNPVGFTFE